MDIWRGEGVAGLLGCTLPAWVQVAHGVVRRVGERRSARTIIPGFSRISGGGKLPIVDREVGEMREKERERKSEKRVRERV